MNAKQPNFEAIKTAFYNAYIKSNESDFAVSMERIKSTSIPRWNVRMQDFRKEFNQWLDMIDIRQAGDLIVALKENNKPVPKWAASFKYNIDYNEYGFLDLIRTDN